MEIFDTSDTQRFRKLLWFDIWLRTVLYLRRRANKRKWQRWRAKVIMKAAWFVPPMRLSLAAYQKLISENLTHMLCFKIGKNLRLMLEVKPGSPDTHIPLLLLRPQDVKTYSNPCPVQRPPSPLKKNPPVAPFSVLPPPSVQLFLL